MKKQQASLLLMNKVIVPQHVEINCVKVEHVATFNANLMSLGFVLSPEVISECSKNLTEAEFEQWSNELRECLITYNGARQNMEPMYPNFPQQVMAASDAELFINAIIHYASNGTWLPEYEKTIKIRTKSIVQPKVIGLADDQELASYAKQLAEMPVSMSEQQKEIFEFLINEYTVLIFTHGIFKMPNKENMAFVIHTIAKLNSNLSDVWVNVLTRDNVHTITDILRIAMAFMNGDVSLTEKTNLDSITRSNRRFLLHLINKCYRDKAFQVIEDAARYQNLWKIVFEKLHPGEYKNRYTYAYQFATKVREDKLRTWYSKLERAYSDKDVNLVVSMLKKRPGEFARRLERTIRLAINSSVDGYDCVDAITVVREFETIADKVDKTILLQLMAYFDKKAEGESASNVRTFFPKGQMSKVYVIEENRTALSPLLNLMCKNACMNALMSIYSDREQLGKVYIDPKVDGFTVPLKLRNASKQLQTVPRGSRIKLPENTNVLRLYTWWKNMEEGIWSGRVDIDLSAVFYNENFDKAMQEVSYYNLRQKGCYHSGDITSAPNGAAEYINIDIETLLNRGVRYIAMSINSFTNINFCDLPECFAGVMAIDSIEDTGPVFDPAKSFIRSDISTASTACIPMVFDLETKEVIWIDSIIPNNNYVNNVEHCKEAIANLVRGVISAPYPTLDDLIILNTLARGGRIVEHKEDADIIFSLDEGITPFNLEIINTEWL